MSSPHELFRHCPRCGAAATPPAFRQPFRCAGCGFVLFFNPAVAVAALIARHDGKLLFIRRAKDPAKGKLGVPGGFIDPGETAEAALVRETKEEVNLELEAPLYLGAWPNEYAYLDVTYPVLDFFFTARARSLEGIAPLDDVAGFAWLNPAEVDPAEIAFPSLRQALRELCAG